MAKVIFSAVFLIIGIALLGISIMIGFASRRTDEAILTALWSLIFFIIWGVMRLTTKESDTNAFYDYFDEKKN